MLERYLVKMKRCSKCGEEKAKEEFNKNKNNKDGYQSACRFCQILTNRLYRKRHPEVGARYQRSEEGKKWRKNIKKIVFDYYGNYCHCSKCPLYKLPQALVFLSIDHINGDGSIQRKMFNLPPGGTSFYSWIVRSNFPNDLQTLCRSCNDAKSNTPICPHHYQPILLRSSSVDMLNK